MGTIPGSEWTYVFDEYFQFEKGRPVLVDGNTAAMLSQTWLAKHFRIQGNRDVHYGAFAMPPKRTPSAAADQPAGVSCCG